MNFLFWNWNLKLCNFSTLVHWVYHSTASEIPEQFRQKLMGGQTILSFVGTRLPLKKSGNSASESEKTDSVSEGATKLCIRFLRLYL